MYFVFGLLAGMLLFSFIRIAFGCLYTVRPDQRAVVTSFGAAQRLEGKQPPPALSEDEQERYEFPQIRVIGPGGPYFKFPWHEGRFEVRSTGFSRKRFHSA